MTEVRSAVVTRSEIWAMNAKQIRQFKQIEMRML